MEAEAAAGLGLLGVLVVLVVLVLSIASIVCFIIVLMKMFEHGQTGLGIACIVLFFCTGIGPLIAFIYGWMKAAEWQIQKVMWWWTGIIIASIVIIPVAWVAFFAAMFAAMPPEGFENFKPENFNPDPVNMIRHYLAR